MAEREQIDPWDGFPGDYKVPVEGLIYLGQLSKEVSFVGHTFAIRTLKPQERASVAKTMEPWQSTLAAEEVYHNAYIGLALVAIDGDTAFLPRVDADLDTFTRIRLEYVTSRLAQPILDWLWAEYAQLELEAFNALGALRDFCERGRTPYIPSVSDSTDKDSSEEEINGETPIST